MLIDTFAFGPLKTAGGEAFCGDPHSRTIPAENLESATTPIGEEEEMTRGGVLFEYVLDNAIESRERLAQIHWSQRDKNPSGGGKGDHDGWEFQNARRKLSAN